MTDEAEPVDAPVVIATDVFDEIGQGHLHHIVRNVLARDPTALTAHGVATPILLIVPTRVAPIEEGEPGWPVEVSHGRDSRFIEHVGLSQTDGVYLVIGDHVTPDLWLRQIDRARRYANMAEAQVSGLRSKLKFLTKQNDAMRTALTAHGLEVGDGGKITVRAGSRRIKI